MAFLGIPTSRKDLSNAGWIRGASTGGARLTANVASALPGKDPAGVQKARNFADAIDDPNLAYTGSLNPYSVLNQIDDKGSAFTRVAPARPGGDFEAPGGMVQGATFDPNATGLGGGVYGAGGAGRGGAAAAYDPNLDPAKIAAKRAEVRGLMSAFEQAFNEVLGKVDVLAAEKRGEFEKNYGMQREGLDRNFGTTTTGIDDQYSARNAYHSSYRENAQNQAREAYDAATGQLTEAMGRDLGSVGQFAEQQKAELAGSRPMFNVDDYNEVDDLLSIQQDVNAALGKIKSTGAGLGTNSQYMSRLNSIAPTQEQGSAQLKGMLDKLVNTGSNPDAKRAIAMSTIAKVGGDQSAWMDYFEKQLKQTGSNAVVDPAMIQLQA